MIDYKDSSIHHFLRFLTFTYKSVLVLINDAPVTNDSWFNILIH